MPVSPDHNPPDELPTTPANVTESPSQNAPQPPSAVQEPPADSPPEEKIPRGRPPILTPEKRRTILALLANGSSRRIAAEFADCSPSTIYRATQRDPEFAAAVATAENNIEVELLRQLRKAARTDRYWRAAAWLLERRNPRDFAQRPPIVLTDQQVVQMFEIVASPFIEKMSDDEFEQSFQRLELLIRHVNERPDSIERLMAPAPPPPPNFNHNDNAPLANEITTDDDPSPPDPATSTDDAPYMGEGPECYGTNRDPLSTGPTAAETELPPALPQGNGFLHAPTTNERCDHRDGQSPQPTAATPLPTTTNDVTGTAK